MGAAVSVEHGDVDWSKAVFALKRVAWVAKGPETLVGFLRRPATAAVVEKFLEGKHPFLACQVTFVREALELLALEKEDAASFEVKLKEMLCREKKNALYRGAKMTRDDTKGLDASLEVGLKFLAEDFLPRLLESPLALDLAKALEEEEEEKDDEKTKKKDYASLFEEAMVGLDDMKVGVCLFCIDEGTFVVANGSFANMTGFSKEEILSAAEPTKFFLSEGSEDNEAVTKAAKEGFPLAQRFTATRKDMSTFQCFLTMTPVSDGKRYKYMACAFVDMNAASVGKVGAQFTAIQTSMGTFFPSSTLCDAEADRALWPTEDDDRALAALLKEQEEEKRNTPREVPKEEDVSLDNTKKERPRLASVGGPTTTTTTTTELDQYGKDFGKKHDKVGLDFETAAPLWFKNAEHALSLLLKTDLGVSIFGAFLEMENRRSLLDFYLKVQELAKIDDLAERKKLSRSAIMDYNKKLVEDKAQREANRKPEAITEEETITSGCKIAKSDLIKGTAAIWAKFYDRPTCEDLDEARQRAENKEALEQAKDWYATASEQAGQTFQMLAVDAFTRFLLSKKSKPLHDALRDQNKDNGANDLGKLARAFRTPLIPQNVEEWLVAFVATIEQWPACIVVADMTVAGAPMVYVNPSFCHVTEYSFDEAVGRNCRFLQGPCTEEISKDIIRRTLKDGRDCHVLITNYRKRGETFKNLLTMRPVFDADAVYRYCIGVQFEVTQDHGLDFELGRLDKLLQLLPSVVPFQGDIRMSEHLPACCVERRNSAIYCLPNSPKRIAVENVVLESARADKHLAQRFAFSKILWLRTPEKTVEALVEDDHGSKALCAAFEQSPSSTKSSLVACAVDFCRKAGELLALTDDLFRNNNNDDGDDKKDDDEGQRVLAEELVASLESENVLFKCTLNTKRGTAIAGDDDWWQHTIEELIQWRSVWLAFLKDACLRPFLNSEAAGHFFMGLRDREVNGESSKLRSAGYDFRTISETLFLDLIHEVAVVAGPGIGLVVSDCSTPGLPLIYISGGFRGVTGYGKEQIGLPCSFLQGPATESSVVEDIVDSLRFAKPNYSRITNYKKNSSPFQCLLSLCPVVSDSSKKTYAFQIGLQVDATWDNADAHLDTLQAIGDLTRFLPTTVSGHG